MPKPRRLAALDTAAVPVAAAPVVTGHSVTFLYKAGGTILGAEDRARLDSLAARLAGGSALTVEIRAYSGTAESVNVETRREALSRAMEVRRLLIAAGVPAKPIRDLPPRRFRRRAELFAAKDHAARQRWLRWQAHKDNGWLRWLRTMIWPTKRD